MVDNLYISCNDTNQYLYYYGFETLLFDNKKICHQRVVYCYAEYGREQKLPPTAYKPYFAIG